MNGHDHLEESATCRSETYRTRLFKRQMVNEKDLYTIRSRRAVAVFLIQRPVPSLGRKHYQEPVCGVVKSSLASISQVPVFMGHYM